MALIARWISVNHFISRLGLIGLLDQYVRRPIDAASYRTLRLLGYCCARSWSSVSPSIASSRPCTASPRPCTAWESKTSNTWEMIGSAVLSIGIYDADRGALLTAVVLSVGKCFAVKFEELHNDSTSIRFYGQYRVQPETVRGQRPARIVFG